MEQHLIEENDQNKDWICLNVGGTVFITTVTTLTRDKNSMLCKMFSGEWNTKNLARDKNGCYLLDGNPRYFEPILTYLRRGEIIIESGISVEGVLAEARYFNVKGIIDVLDKKEKNGDDDVNWEHIGGLDGVKQELQQLVDNTIKYKDLFLKNGVYPGKNILLYGPPGCGKTLLAKATAKKMQANFLLIKCPELLHDRQYAPQLLQQKFSEARSMGLCVIFFEEFECLASIRHGDVLNDPVISQLAISLDYIRSNENIFVIAATNRPDLIEPALLRPGRIDQLIYIPLPNQNARLEIFKTALRKALISNDVDLVQMAEMSNGLSGADLVEICQRACVFCIREIISTNRSPPEKLLLTKKHFEFAMKSARRSVSDQDVYRFLNFNKILQKVSTPLNDDSLDQNNEIVDNVKENKKKKENKKDN